MQKTEQELKAKAIKYFERSNADKIHITSDGMMFVRIEHAQSHKAGSDLKLYSFERKDLIKPKAPKAKNEEGAKDQPGQEGAADTGQNENTGAGQENETGAGQEVDNKGDQGNTDKQEPATKEEAIEVLKTIEVEKADYSLLVTLGGLLEVSLPNKKKATLINALVELKSKQ